MGRKEWRRRWLEAVGGDTEVVKGRRADAVWVDRSGRVEVHEIKRSRADLVNELRQPEKSAVWLQVAHRFWLTLADRRVANGVHIPPDWGILLLAGRRLPEVVSPAPLLSPPIELREKELRRGVSAAKLMVACRLPPYEARNHDEWLRAYLEYRRDRRAWLRASSDQVPTRYPRLGEDQVPGRP